MLTVDYRFYHETYHGELSQEDFNKQTWTAAAALDDLTMSRASGHLTEDETLHCDLALCAMIDAADLYDQMGGITEQRNDGVSVSYAPAEAGKSKAQRIRDAALPYLAQTNLLYRGVD